ncbi:hypothetical protein L2750_09435 [Shewanella submarina]|uniref:Pilus assembly protein n=1 Tax=Shewanella submarina TaxID=2016376 RepID=A0ABV7G7E0_9GAMM|nr:hypothetical protein [Shewanella submarina]MCL1037376.1 hypothetical protein [Shewanella submarina]
MNPAYNSTYQRGGVLAEFSVICGFVLIPLAMLMPLLFKFIESKQLLEQAARYAAWERVAYYQTKPKNRDRSTPVKTDTQIKYELRNRIFSHRDTKIYLAQNKKTTKEKLNPVLQINHVADSRGVEIYKKAKNDSDFFHSSKTQEHGLSGFGKVSSALGKVLSLAPGFELNQKGLYQSTVSTQLRMYDWFPELGKNAITTSRTNALLAEGWMIGGPDRVKKELKYLVPITAAMDQIGLEKFLRILSILPLAKELGWIDLAKLEPDAVPCVRLGKFGRNGKVSTPQHCNSRLKTKLKELGHR